MFDWFTAQSDEVKGAVILALGGIFTVAGGLLTAIVSAIGTTVNGVWSRRYERGRLGHERLLEKRSQNAEVIIDKLSQFHIQAFATMGEIREAAGKLRKDLHVQFNTNGIAIDAATYTAGGYRTSSPFDDSLAAAFERLTELKERVNKEDKEAEDWFHHEAFRHWAWFKNPSKIARSMQEIEKWYQRFYFELSNEINALRALYNSAPSQNVDYKEFRRERDDFAKRLEKHSLKAFGFFREDGSLITEMSKLQNALLAYLT